MRELGTSTSEDIATMMVSKLMRSNPSLSGQETIRRRVYDVINVLSAACVIDKVGKQIIWRGDRRCYLPGTRSPSSAAEEDVRIASKERILRDKVSILTLYKALIMRNFPRPPAPDALALPVILVGIRDAERTTFTQSLNRCELEIRSRGELTFIGPSDILFRINLPKQSVKSILELSPDMSRYGTQLLDDADSGPPDE
jgi:hypothetical protein